MSFESLTSAKALQQSITVSSNINLTGTERVVYVVATSDIDIQLAYPKSCRGAYIHLTLTGIPSGGSYTITITAPDCAIYKNGSGSSSISFTDTTVDDHVTLYSDGSNYYEIEGDYS